MKKRQKLILLLYALSAFFFGFLYVPYTEHYGYCMDSYAGHHYRHGFATAVGMDFWSSSQTRCTIDSNMILAELFLLTALAGAGILFFKDKENYQRKMNGPF